MVTVLTQTAAVVETPDRWLLTASGDILAALAAADGTPQVFIAPGGGGEDDLTITLDPPGSVPTEATLTLRARGDSASLIVSLVLYDGAGDPFAALSGLALTTSYVVYTIPLSVVGAGEDISGDWSLVITPGAVVSSGSVSLDHLVVDVDGEPGGGGPGGQNGQQAAYLLNCCGA